MKKLLNRQDAEIAKIDRGWLLASWRLGGLILSLIVILFFLRTLTLPVHVYAQEAPAATPAITFDQVNAVAKKLYCPVCPNETLNDCQTQACAQWRDEIRDQLAAGQSEAQVIDSFVRRYGERVLAIPQDPLLHGLSVITPFALAAVALILGAITFLRWRRPPQSGTGLDANPPQDRTASGDDAYRARLERDLHD